MSLFLLLLICMLSVSSLVAGNREKMSEESFTLSNFTDEERNSVSCPTRGLFDSSGLYVADLSRYTSKDWSYPLRGGKVISPFGGSRKNHQGIDIKTYESDTIYAVFSGRVRFSKPFFGYGNAVVIRHYNGTETLYSHNRNNLVNYGDYVHAGQPIAIIGRTGRATTEHCHFEVRINGRPYNPDLFFDCSCHRLRPVKVIVSSSGKIKIIRLSPKQDTIQSPQKIGRDN